MITLRFSPSWFYGYDIIFEVLAVLVTFLIGLAFFRLYRFSKDYRYQFMGFSFWAFTLSFLAKIATNFVIYYHQTVKQSMGDMVVKYNLVQKSNFFFEAGYDIHRFLMLMGLIGIYWLVSKSRDEEHKFLFMYLLLVITLFSFHLYLFFHLTATVLLIFIVKHYKQVCDKNKNNLKAHLNFFAFVLILLSQVVFIFVWLSPFLYVIAEIIQLMGFIIFLINLLLLVLGKNGKKKK